jgi:CDP-paratose 2-epimerase
VKILITGGAGFVGSSLARAFVTNHSDAQVVVLDNLRRRGSELNLRSFRTLGIRFIHGDIRNFADFSACGTDFDLCIEASAEPSVLAGLNDEPDYVVDTNLGGTFNCLKFARHHVRQFVFLSTSRVYSIPSLREIALEETGSRFVIQSGQALRGVSPAGISEEFSTQGFRSFYGATKLASELLVQEFAAAYGLDAVIYRCGVIAGPGQFGKTDQGVFTLWVAHHYFGLPLQYTGFGGGGKQVRDLLHPVDLYRLIEKSLGSSRLQSGRVYNVGGGLRGATSLAELTGHCRRIVGTRVPVESRAQTNSVDVPLFISDHAALSADTGWQPERRVADIVDDIFQWIRSNEPELRPIFT